MNEPKNINEIILNSEPIFAGDYLTIDRVMVELPDGRRAYRDVVRHPGAVAVLALNDQGDILLERQYRTALDEVILEIPDRMIANDVDPIILMEVFFKINMADIDAGGVNV